MAGENSSSISSLLSAFVSKTSGARLVAGSENGNSSDYSSIKVRTKAGDSFRIVFDQGLDSLQSIHARDSAYGYLHDYLDMSGIRNGLIGISMGTA